MTSMNVLMILTDVTTMQIVEILLAVINVDVELDLMVMVTNALMLMNVSQAWSLGQSDYYSRTVRSEQPLFEDIMNVHNILNVPI